MLFLCLSLSHSDLVAFPLIRLDYICTAVCLAESPSTQYHDEDKECPGCLLDSQEQHMVLNTHKKPFNLARENDTHFPSIFSALF